MEILHNEIVDQSMPIIALVILIILTIGLTVVVNEMSNKIIASMFFIMVSLVWLSIYSEYKVDIVEYQKVKVTDWNIVHDEGWEVIKQEGEIVELKRELEDK